jgi:hypothetical protein
MTRAGPTSVPPKSQVTRYPHVALEMVQLAYLGVVWSGKKKFSFVCCLLEGRCVATHIADGLGVITLLTSTTDYSPFTDYTLKVV